MNHISLYHNNLNTALQRHARHAEFHYNFQTLTHPSIYLLATISFSPKKWAPSGNFTLWRSSNNALITGNQSLWLKRRLCLSFGYCVNTCYVDLLLVSTFDMKWDSNRTLKIWEYLRNIHWNWVGVSLVPESVCLSFDDLLQGFVVAL